MANKGSKAAAVANPWVWFVGLVVFALLWRWALLIGGIALLLFAWSGKNRRAELRVAIGVGGLLCLGVVAWSVFPTTTATVAETQAPAATAPVAVPEPTPAPAAPVAESEALKWLKTMNLTVIGKGMATSWEEFANQAPTEDLATFKFSKLGAERWYKFTFHDGSTMDANFEEPHGVGNGLELNLVNISPESDQSLY